MPPRNEESEERKARATYPARTIETRMRELTVLRRNLFIAGKEPLLGVCSREIERRVALRRASNIRRKREIFQDEAENFPFSLPHCTRPSICSFPFIFLNPFLPVMYFVFSCCTRVCSKRFPRT